MSQIKLNKRAILSLLTVMFEAFVLKSETVEAQEEKLRESIRELNEAERNSFFNLFSKQVKDPDTYAALNFFIITGLHHFYLKRYIRGSINLTLFCIAIVGSFIGFLKLGQGLSIIVLIVLVEIPNLFRSQIVVKDYNNRLTEKILLKSYPL